VKSGVLHNQVGESTHCLLSSQTCN